MTNEAMPILLGPRKPFRNIERILKKKSQKQQNLYKNDKEKNMMFKFESDQIVSINGSNKSKIIKKLDF
jgi:hypothetical protein